MNRFGDKITQFESNGCWSVSHRHWLGCTQDQFIPTTLKVSQWNTQAYHFVAFFVCFIVGSCDFSGSSPGVHSTRCIYIIIIQAIAVLGIIQLKSNESPTISSSQAFCSTLIRCSAGRSKIDCIVIVDITLRIFANPKTYKAKSRYLANKQNKTKRKDI